MALAFAFGNASAATSAAAPDAGEATVSSPDSLPLEILQAAAQGDMQKVLEWLDKGGSVDAVYSYSVPTRNARKWTRPFMPTPEEVGKEIDLSGEDLSTYGGFALDLDLDEDNYEDEDEDEDYFTQDDLAAVDEAIRTKLSGADLSGERQRLEWLRRGADDLSGSKIRADGGFGNVTIDLVDSTPGST